MAKGEFAVTLSLITPAGHIREQAWGADGVRIFEHPYLAAEAVEAWSTARPGVAYWANMNEENYYVIDGVFLTAYDRELVETYLESEYYAPDQEPYVPLLESEPTLIPIAVPRGKMLEFKLDGATVRVDAQGVYLRPADGYALGSEGLWHNEYAEFRLAPVATVPLEELTWLDDPSHPDNQISIEDENDVR